jgi:hypothetical protein
MMRLTFIFTIPFVFLFGGFSKMPKENADISSIYGGTSPCATSIRSFLKISATEKCDEVSWHLELNKDENKNPTTFILKRGYKYYIDNSTSQPKGFVTIEGGWKVTKGRKSQVNAAVIELKAQHTSEPLRFYVADENIIHLLDKEGNLMIGDGGQSYTLSRIQ